MIDPVGVQGAYDLASRAPNESREEQIRKAAAMLEGVFLRQMLKEMRKSIHESGLFKSSMGHDMSVEMFDSAIADEASQNGGLGLQDMLVMQMGGTASGMAKANHPKPTISAQRATLQFKQIAALDSTASAAGQHNSLPQASSAFNPTGTGQKRSASGIGQNIASLVRKTSAVDQPLSSRGASLGGIQYEPPNRPEAVKLSDADGRLHWPISGESKVVDGRGTVAARPSTEVMSAGSGRIIAADSTSLVILHGHGLTTKYVGLGKVQAQVGDLVLRGQTLGTIGDNGMFQFSATKAGRELKLSEMSSLFSNGE